MKIQPVHSEIVGFGLVLAFRTRRACSQSVSQETKREKTYGFTVGWLKGWRLATSERRSEVNLVNGAGNRTRRVPLLFSRGFFLLRQHYYFREDGRRKTVSSDSPCSHVSKARQPIFAWKNGPVVVRKRLIVLFCSVCVSVEAFLTVLCPRIPT